MPESAFLTVAQAAARMGRSEDFVRLLCRKGELTGAVRDSKRGRWRIPAKAVDEWMTPESQPTEASQGAQVEGDVSTSGGDFIGRDLIIHQAEEAYDVRGLYPTQLDEAGAYAIGRAYVEQFDAKRVAVGRDMRVSSPSIAGSVREGAADAGADVFDLGLVGTEMLYFAVGELGLDGGIAVTASHNP